MGSLCLQLLSTLLYNVQVDGYHTSKQNAATSRSEADVIHMHSPQVSSHVVEV